MRYRLEQTVDGKEVVTHLGEVTQAAARGRASRISAKPGDMGFGDLVHLYGADADGTDQEFFSYFAGMMAEKDLVADWDR